MIKEKFFTSTLVIALAASLGACHAKTGQAKASKKNIGTKAQSTYKGPRYVGYYANAQTKVGKGNYTEELKDVGNTLWISGPDWESKLARAKELGKHVIITLHESFINIQTFQLQPEPDEKWAKLAPVFKKYQDIIAAFYTMDEPYWGAKERGVSSMGMKANMEKLASLVHQDFPEHPVAVIFATPSLIKGIPVPEGHSWFGFDCYRSYDRCGDAIHGYRSIPEYMTLLEGLMPENLDYKLFLVPGAIVMGRKVPDLKAQKEVVKIAKRYMDIAKTNDRVIGLFPFIYNSSAMHIGPVDMPYVHKEMTSLIKAFENLN